jgi:hypothetical protein
MLDMAIDCDQGKVIRSHKALLFYSVEVGREMSDASSCWILFNASSLACWAAFSIVELEAVRSEPSIESRSAAISTLSSWIRC